jgi:hypothetical protein
MAMMRKKSIRIIACPPQTVQAPFAREREIVPHERGRLRHPRLTMRKNAHNTVGVGFGVRAGAEAAAPISG